MSTCSGDGIVFLRLALDLLLFSLFFSSFSLYFFLLSFLLDCVSSPFQLFTRTPALCMTLLVSICFLRFLIMGFITAAGEVMDMLMDIAWHDIVSMVWALAWCGST